MIKNKAAEGKQIKAKSNATITQGLEGPQEPNVPPLKESPAIESRPTAPITQPARAGLFMQVFSTYCQRLASHPTDSGC